jgi:hypothetical protein
MRYAVLVSIFVCGAAWAAPTDFSAGSWIIPMDACYQTSQGFNGSGSFSGTNQTSTFYASCPDISTNTGHDGIIKAYGLVYRLIQNNIPVYYILNPSKTSVDGTDLTITNNSGNPVDRLSHTNWHYNSFMSGSHHSISYRGAPFIVSATDVPAALNLLQNDPNFTYTDPRTGRVVFRDVQIHHARVNITQAPVRAILNQLPPKIALMDIGGAAIDVLQGYLMDAGLSSATATANYPSTGDIFTAFTNVTDFTSGGLTTGGFKVLWAPHWDGSNNSSTDRDSIVSQIGSFVDAGNSFFAQCAALATMEGSTSSTGSGSTAPATSGHFQTTSTSTDVGLSTNNLTNPFPLVAGDKIVVNPDTTVQAWLNPLAQTGDFPLALNISSFTYDYTPASGFAYRSFVQPLVQSQSNISTENNQQIETIAYKDGDVTKGQIIYLSGHSYGSQGSTCSATCTVTNQWDNPGLERLVLNTFLFIGLPQSVVERTRSAPIVYSDGNTFLGSYILESQQASAFPPWRGHFREYPPSALSGANVAAFSSLAATWDAASHIATQAASHNRTILTAVPVAGKLTGISFTAANLAALQTVAPSLTSNIISYIIEGGLGGIDHSIPAVIGPSQVAGSPSRPTVAYVGALDGMLHAILVSGSAGGKSPGDELWAFIPPSQLDKTATQSGGVDGSPTVGDAFIDTGSGTKTWRTLIGVTTGSYTGGTISVLDITDPLNPAFLWTGSDTVTDGSGLTYVMGRAQGAAFAPVMTGSGLGFAFFLLTDNTSGNAGNGFNAYALDAGNGNVLWRLNHLYDTNTTNNDVPGTIAVIDAAGDGGPATKAYFAGIEGRVWSVDAATGNNLTVLYDAAAAHGAAGSTDYPVEAGVVLYRDPGNSHLSILGVTGGADWVDPNVPSSVFRVDATNPSVYSDLLTLAAGERVYAVPTIYGNSAYLITSKGNLQGGTGTDFTAQGSLIRIGLGSSSQVTTLASVTQGAAEVAVDSGGNVIAASTTGLTKNSNSGRDTSQTTISLQNAAAKQITVRAWLDLH